MKIIAHQGDTVDAICWRYYQRTAGVTELVLKANPGLSDLGVIIPHGTPVELPDIAPVTNRKMVQLWD